MLATPPPRGTGAAAGALACFDLWGDLDPAFARAGLAPIPVGHAPLRALGGVDRGIVARWSPTAATIMPHGGPAVVAGVARWLRDAGLTQRPSPRVRPSPDDDRELLARYPEASDALEARMLAVLALAASPLAVDLLLQQPARWRDHPAGPPSPADLARWARLDRLIDPPLVVALGRPNIGKSSLLNALAGRSVALVADLPGTTRDAVGARLDLGGLAVRYLDTPGLSDPPPGWSHSTAEPLTHAAIALEAEHAARALAATADLLLLCGDHAAPFLPVPPAPPGRAGPSIVRVALRDDLGHMITAADQPPPDVRVSTADDRGLEALVSLVRETLVPAADLADTRPWRFWREPG